jgi:DNA-binding NarL/FixJ family response regulator
MIYPLKKSGYEIKIVEDLSDGLKEVENGTFDLILLDVLIPSGDKNKTKYEPFEGLNFLRIIREKGLNTPIVVFSVVNDSDILGRLRQLNVAAIIPKGHCRPSELKEEIDKIFGIGN